VWLYRITECGVRDVQEFFRNTCTALPGVRARDPNPGVYLPAPHRAALLLLRDAQRDPAVPIHFGERGWLAARELAARVDVPNSVHASLSFLHRKGLVESRVEPACAVERPARAYYRATELGHSLALLEWKPMPDVPAPSPRTAPGEQSD
jgi:DNA-binding PadR family transcriptional regulator